MDNIKFQPDNKLICDYVKKPQSLDFEIVQYTNEYDDIIGKYIISMIAAYYSDNVNVKYAAVKQYVKSIYLNAYNLYKAQHIKDILENDNTFEYNDSPSVGPVFNEINEMYEYYINKLCALVTVKFERDERYSDTPQTVMEYLQYDYVKELTDISESLREDAYANAVNDIIDSQN